MSTTHTGYLLNHNILLVKEKNQGDGVGGNHFAEKRAIHSNSLKEQQFDFFFF
jgi:hypothetical protein